MTFIYSSSTVSVDRSALPEWDMLWLLAVLRSIWPASKISLHSIPLTYGPLAWVLVVLGFLPLGRRIVRRLFGKQKHLRVRNVLWYSLLVYLSLLFVSYSISHEDDVRWDKIFRTIIFGPIPTTKKQ